MHWRTTLILLLVTIGIGAYVSLRELKQPTREDQALLADQVMSVAPDAVTQLILKNSKGTVTVEHSDHGWRLAPQQLRADESRVSGVLDQLSPLTAERVLAGTPEKPLDYAAFGLAPEQGSLTVVVNGRLTTLLFGHVTPVGQLRYAKLTDHPQVYLVPASSYDEWDVLPEQFRNPYLIPVTGWTATALAVATQTSAFALAHHGEAWWLTQPLEDRADRNAVTTLVNRLGSLRIARFMEDAPPVERLAEYGFDQPMAEPGHPAAGRGTAELRVTMTGAPGPVSVFFGKTLPNAPGMVYAKRSDEQALYAVAASDVDALLVDPHGLRSKACFEFFTSQVNKMELQAGQTHWVAVKQNGQWKEEGSGTPLDATRVEDFLNTAADLRLGGFVEDAPAALGRYGLDAPSGILTIWIAGTDAPQRLLIGGQIEKTGNRYGRIEGRLAVVRLPEIAGKLLDITVESLRPAQPVPAPTTPAPTAPHASQ